MRTVFDTCRPRDEVLRGELREQQFAASLTRVLRGDADAIYGDPATFFRNSYATGGLGSLLQEALGRLSGRQPTNAPVIRVETSFGGGKTHNLIALYHSCRTPEVTRSFPDFVPGGLLSDKPVRLLAGVVGGDLDAANGVDHGDARTFTLWGEIAYQLRGVEGYGLVRHSDEQRVAPGTQVWEKLIGAEPALVMIDEIAQHLRSAKAVKSSGGGTNLAEQTVAFLMSLIKFAAESPRSEYFNRMIGQGVDLPSRATRPEFRAEVGQDYAFHPELLTTLNRKTSTIPNFQKTRGVLRLLAQVLRGLWRDRPADCYLIAPHHLDLGDPTRFGRPGSGRVVRCSGRCTSGSPSCSCIALSSTSRGRSSTASRPWPGKSTPDFRPRTDC